MVGDREGGKIGPQHWLCEKLWRHLGVCYELSGWKAEAQRVVRLRVEYQRHAYTGISCMLAHTLEEEADMLLRHFGFKMENLCLEDLGAPALQRIEKEVLRNLDQSLRMFQILFGPAHTTTTCVRLKHKHISELLNQHRAWDGASPWLQWCYHQYLKCAALVYENSLYHVILIGGTISSWGSWIELGTLQLSLMVALGLAVLLAIWVPLCEGSTKQCQISNALAWSLLLVSTAVQSRMSFADASESRSLMGPDD